MIVGGGGKGRGGRSYYINKGLGIEKGKRNNGFKCFELGS